MRIISHNKVEELGKPLGIVPQPGTVYAIAEIGSRLTAQFVALGDTNGVTLAAKEYRGILHRVYWGPCPFKLPDSAKWVEVLKSDAQNAFGNQEDVIIEAVKFIETYSVANVCWYGVLNGKTDFYSYSTRDEGVTKAAVLASLMGEDSSDFECRYFKRIK